MGLGLEKTNIAAPSFGANCQGLIVQIIKQGALASEPAAAQTELLTQGF